MIRYAVRENYPRNINAAKGKKIVRLNKVDRKGGGIFLLYFKSTYTGGRKILT